MISFSYPWLLLAIPVLLVILYRLMKKEVVGYDERFADEKHARKQQSKRRKRLFFSRSIIIILLVAAMAQPITTQDLLRESDPRIDVLIDESSSMQVFAQTDLVERLREHTNVQTHTIATGNTSSLSDSILSQLQPGGHVVLISDGQITSGSDLSSVASYAASIQATINAVELPVMYHDASIQIRAEEVVTQDTPTQITIDVFSTDGQARTIETYIDDELIDTRQASESFSIQHRFSRGDHVIRSQILEEDTIAVNNEFTKTITATPQVEVLLLTQRASDFQSILEELYDVDARASMPADINKYAAIILYDLPRSAISTREADIQSYLSSGGGMVVVGGENSYEFGGYQNSLLETMLPVRVAEGASQQPSANIVIAIDLSNRALGSVELVDGEFIEATGEVQSIQKALAVDLLNRLNLNNRVGAVGFTYPLPQHDSCTGACVLGRVGTLGENKDQLINNIARVNITGGTSISTGIKGSIQLLQEASGSDNIVLISDGVTGQEDRRETIEAVRVFNAQGGTVHTVHVGNSEQGFAFMQQIAAAGEGIAFLAGRNNRLATLFGQPQEREEEDAFAVLAINEHHYITESLESSATLFGYNQVLAKNNAQELLSSSAGRNVLTIWNYGIGRVASITGYSQQDLGSLLIPPNSQYIARTVNWAIGPLERVQEQVIIASDARVGEEVDIYARGVRPESSQARFIRTDSNEYQASIPAQEMGVYEVASASYAVNYPREFDRLGISESLREAVDLSGGEMYAESDTQAIITHARTLSEIKDLQANPLTWPFIIIALIIYVLEVCVRRIASMKKRS